MSSRLNYSTKQWIKYDKLNTKYNRLWSQVTNLFVYIFASLVAYSIAYLQFLLGNKIELTIIISKLIMPIAFTIFPVAVLFAILSTFLYIAGKEVHIVLSKHRIFN